jgi:hypothetical protein
MRIALAMVLATSTAAYAQISSNPISVPEVVPIPDGLSQGNSNQSHGCGRRIQDRQKDETSANESIARYHGWLLRCPELRRRGGKAS